MAVSPEELEAAIRRGEAFVVDALRRKPRNVESMGDMQLASELVLAGIMRCLNLTDAYIDWGGSFDEADGKHRPMYEHYLELTTTEG